MAFIANCILYVIILCKLCAYFKISPWEPIQKSSIKAQHCPCLYLVPISCFPHQFLGKLVSYFTSLKVLSFFGGLRLILQNPNPIPLLPSESLYSSISGQHPLILNVSIHISIITRFSTCNLETKEKAKLSLFLTSLPILIISYILVSFESNPY